MSNAIVNVELGSRSYRIEIGRTAIELDRRRPGLLVMDDRVSAACGKTAAAAFPGLENFVFPAGEASKNADTLFRLLRRAAAGNLPRDCRFIACGGGVTGDLTGFAAAVYLRGVRFLQVPTTLLAMVDSSVGGKTAVDLPEGKNLVGAFHQPEAVWINPDFLRTLPKAEVANGLAEIVKTAVIRDADLFAELEKRAPELYRTCRPDGYVHIIKRCCEIKADVVSRDERENNLRAILNYGHSFGHAIELLTGFSVSHGQAVAIGMECAGRLALNLGRWSEADYLRQGQLLDALRLPRRLPAGLTSDAMLAAMRRDKKNRAGRPVLVLPNKIGEVEVVSGLSESEIATCLPK